MKIKRIQVLSRGCYHPDIVTFELEGVTSPFPHVEGESAAVSTRVQGGYGEEWVRLNFPEVTLVGVVGSFGAD